MGLCCRRGTHVSPFITKEAIIVDRAFTQLKEVGESSDIMLLRSLNSSCLLPATPADLKSLDLYAHLSSMPKNSSDEVDGAGDGIPQGSRNKNKKIGQDQTPTATKRELGRLKNKKALARAMEGSLGREVDGEDADEGWRDGENERENKRSRSEFQDTETEERGDVLMNEPL